MRLILKQFWGPRPFVIALLSGKPLRQIMAGDAVVIDAEKAVHAEQMFRVAVLNGEQGAHSRFNVAGAEGKMFLACTKYLRFLQISFDVLEI